MQGRPHRPAFLIIYVYALLSVNCKWIAQICFKRTNYRLGYYSNIEDAAKARKDAEEKFYKPIIEKYKGEKNDGN